jgi:hypothetical protein
MNITDSISKEIGGDIEKIIKEHKAIQFYWNASIEKYQWLDSRFDSTANVWLNQDGKDRVELIEIFKKHLVSVM